MQARIVAGLVLAIAAGAAERAPDSSPVYRFSVVEGGVYSPAELTEARKDPVVAGHYRMVDHGQVRAVVLDRDRLGYVSYRSGGRVFWTKRPVLIHAGETVLCDGQNRIRARTGSLIADRPMSPVRIEDPSERELEEAEARERGVTGTGVSGAR